MVPCAGIYALFQKSTWAPHHKIYPTFSNTYSLALILCAALQAPVHFSETFNNAPPPPRHPAPPASVDRMEDGRMLFSLLLLL